MTLERPRPPAILMPDEGSYLPEFVPAPEVEEWVRATFLDEGGPLFNPDHGHLTEARLGFLWTNEPAASGGHPIVGTAEIPLFRGKPWVKARQERQVHDWFGGVPDFLVTLFAPYAGVVDAATWCALVEHELYHCAQAIDKWGQPRFRKSDHRPVFVIRGHDVEEFVGVVRRYGPGASAGATAELVKAARKRPEVAEASLRAACGTCLRIAA